MNLERYFIKEEIEYLINCEDLYDKCYFLVLRLFLEKIDKVGIPYINHLCFVAKNLDNIYEKCAGLLHDTLEDIEGLTVQDLKYIGIPDEVIEMVLIVTKRDGESYDEFINRIIDSNNDGALRVKYYDMLNNSDSERLEQLDEVTRERLKNKYTPQLKKIRGAIKERKI